jgi:hypothetical protein
MEYRILEHMTRGLLHVFLVTTDVFLAEAGCLVGGAVVMPTKSGLP